MKLLNYIKKNKKIAIALNIFPILVTFIYIFLWSVNIPFLHDWIFLHHVMDFNQEDWLYNFWRPQNGQRNFFPQIIYFIVYRWYSFNTLSIIWLNFFFIVGSYSLIWKLFQNEFRISYYSFIPISWLFFSLVQYGNILVSWQISLNLSIFTSLLSFYFIQKNTYFSFLLSMFFVFISVGSFGNGLLMLPIIALYIIANKFPLWKSITWISYAIIIIVFYFFINYSTAGVSPSYNIPRFYLFFTNLLSNTTLLPLGKTGGVMLYFGLLTGSVLFLYVIIQLFIFVKNYKIKAFSQSSLYILLYSSLIVIQISIGRSGNEIKGAYGTQYTTFIILLLVSLFAIQLKNSFKSRILTKLNKVIISFFLIGSIIIGGTFGFIMGPYLYGRYLTQKSILYNYSNQSVQIQKQIRGGSQVIISEILNKFKNESMSIYNKEFNVYMNPYIDNTALSKSKITNTYFNLDTLSFQIITSIDSIKNISLLVNVINPNEIDYLKLEMTADDKVVFRDSLNSKDIFLNGRAFFEFINPIIVDEIFPLKMKIITTGHSINIVKFPKYERSPIKSTIINQDSIIGVEINTPFKLKGYYLTKSLRNRVKYIIKN